MIRRADPPNDDDKANQGNSPDDPLNDLPSSGKPYDPLDKDADPFKPPAEPTEVGCLHCRGFFMSDQMTYRIETNADGEKHGFWCCPDPACDGKGFGFDLLPTDPNYRDEHGGWFDCDDEDDDDDYDEEDDLFDTDDENSPDSFDPPRDWTGYEDDEDDIPF